MELDDLQLSFESAIFAFDSSTVRLRKLARRARRNERQRAKKKLSKSELTYSAEDVFGAALSAVAAVTGTTVPDFNLDSSPQEVYTNTVKELIKFADQARDEGSALAASRCRKFDSTTSLAALTLIQTLQSELNR